MPAPVAYQPAADRYDGAMPYRRCGRSGLDLPAISLGLWQNFGGVDVFETGRAVVRRAFDRGVTHFDLANNYGPPYGSAEENFGRILAAYGGVFVAGSLVWGMVMDGFRPDRYDIAGALVCLVGVAVIMYAPRDA